MSAQKWHKQNHFQKGMKRIFSSVWRITFLVCVHFLLPFLFCCSRRWRCCCHCFYVYVMCNELFFSLLNTKYVPLFVLKFFRSFLSQRQIGVMEKQRRRRRRRWRSRSRLERDDTMHRQHIDNRWTKQKHRNKHMCVELLLDASANLVHSWMPTGRTTSVCRKETNIDVKTAHSHTSQNVYQQRCHYKRIEKAKLCMMACAPHPIYYNLLLSREKRCSSRLMYLNWEQVSFAFSCRWAFQRIRHKRPPNSHTFSFSLSIIEIHTKHIDDISSGTRRCCAHIQQFSFLLFSVVFFLLVRHIVVVPLARSNGAAHRQMWMEVKTLRRPKRIKIHLAHCWMYSVYIHPKRNKPKQQIFSIDGK